MPSDAPPPLPPSPSVSVVIPVRNEMASIGAALDSIRRQDYAGPIEIIVADAASTDGTRRFLDAQPDVQVVDNPDRITPAGLNRAIAASSGDVVVRCDAHSELPADYVRTAVSLLVETGAANVGGIQRAVGDGFWQNVIAAAMSTPIGVGDARFHYGGEAGPTDTVYLGVFHRGWLERVGGFDESLARNQDYELNIRLRAAGGVVYFDPTLMVTYRPRASLRALWRQYYDYGKWKRRVVTQHPESLRLRQLAPPLLVIGLIGSAAAAWAGWWPVASIVPGAWAAALAAGTVQAVARLRSVHAAFVAIPAAVMHLAWGLGFLAGR